MKFVGSIGSDEIDTNGKVAEPEFEVKLNPLGFDLAKCVSQQGELTMSMLNGDCAGCNFKVLRINGKNAQVNKATYFYIEPKEICYEENTSGIINQQIFLGSYTKFSNPEKVYINEVGFGFADKIENKTPDSLQFEMRTYLKGRKSSSEITLSNFNQTILSNSSYILSDKILIPKTTLANLSADNWDIMVNLFISPYSNQPAWSASINAEFSTISPFIVEGDITYDDGAVSPIDQDVILTLQK